MSFTFKKESRSGMYRVFQKRVTTIKKNKKQVGGIRQTENFDWQIGLVIKKEKTTENPAPFRWIYFKKKFDEEKEARVWLKDHHDSILEKYELHHLED